jgi:hypothetical protein
MSDWSYWIRIQSLHDTRPANDPPAGIPSLNSGESLHFAARIPSIVERESSVALAIAAIPQSPNSGAG